MTGQSAMTPGTRSTAGVTVSIFLMLKRRLKITLRCSAIVIKKAEPVTDQKVLALREKYMEDYRYDYAYKDPGSSPLKSYFGEEWGERFMKEFLFAP